MYIHNYVYMYSCVVRGKGNLARERGSADCGDRNSCGTEDFIDQLSN